MSAPETLIEEVRRLDAAASPPPWIPADNEGKADVDHGVYFADGLFDPEIPESDRVCEYVELEADRQLIARYRTLAPQLATELKVYIDDERRAQERITRLKRELACPGCGCADERDALAKECGCDHIVCSRDGSTPLSFMYTAAVEDADEARKAMNEAMAALREERQNAEGLRERLAEAERMRDAYRKAKQENDDRFMCERDAAEARAKAAEELAAVRDIALGKLREMADECEAALVPPGGQQVRPRRMVIPPTVIKELRQIADEGSATWTYNEVRKLEAAKKAAEVHLAEAHRGLAAYEEQVQGLEERVAALEKALGMLVYDENGHINNWPSEAETRRVLQAAGSAK